MHTRSFRWDFVTTAIPLAASALASTLAHAEAPQSIADLFLDSAFIAGCLGTDGGTVALHVDDTYAESHDSLVEQIHDNLRLKNVASELLLYDAGDSTAMPKCGDAIEPAGKTTRLSLYLTFYQDRPGNFSRADLVIYRGATCHQIDLTPGKWLDSCGAARPPPRPRSTQEPPVSPVPVVPVVPVPAVRPQEDVSPEAVLSAPLQLQFRIAPFVLLHRGTPVSGGAETDYDFNFEPRGGVWVGAQARVVGVQLDGDRLIYPVFSGHLGYSGDRAGASLVAGSAIYSPYLRIGPRLRFGRLARTHARIVVLWLSGLPFPVYSLTDVLIRVPHKRVPIWINLQSEWIGDVSLTIGPRFAVPTKSAGTAHFIAVTAGAAIGMLVSQGSGPVLTLGYEVRFNGRVKGTVPRTSAYDKPTAGAERTARR